MSPVPSSRCYLQYKVVSPAQGMPITSNTSNTELSCSHVLSQRSLFSLRIRSQFCSQSWRLSSFLPIIIFIYQEEAFRDTVLTSSILPWGSGKQPRGFGSGFTKQPSSQNAESSLCQRFLVQVLINFHSRSSFRVDISHTVCFVLLLWFSHYILFCKD